MSKKHIIYEITIAEEILDSYKSENTSAKDVAENLGIDSVMTDFEWDEDIKRGRILTARVIDDISVEDALSELENVEFVENVDES